jgi:hypothetical protein
VSRVGARVDALTAEVDDASSDAPVTVRGWQAGPAGVATVDLLDGAAELDIDVAEPDLLVSLRLHDPRTRPARRLARILLGPTAAAALDGFHRNPGEPVVVWERIDDRVRDLRPRTRRPGGLGLVGRLGLTLCELGVPGRSDAAIAVGLVDAAMTAADLRVDLAPQPTGSALLAAGLLRWDALPAGALDGATDLLGQLQGRWLKTAFAIDPDQGDQLKELFARHGGSSQPAAEGAARGGGRSATQLDRSWLAGAAGSAMAPAAALAAAPMASEAAADAAVAAFPSIEVAFDAILAAADARVVNVERTDHHLVVHLGGLPGGRPDAWLRVFADDSTGPVPLAFAPIPDADRPWRTAVALVPAEVPNRKLLVDVTLSPKDRWPSPTARSVGAAVHLGAEAARAGRRSDADAATRWDHAASAWDELGDDRRADLAREYAAFAPQVDPLIGDLL